VANTGGQYSKYQRAAALACHVLVGTVIVGTLAGGVYLFVRLTW